MKVEKVNLKQVATNDENPRSITDTKFAKLVNNVLSFPKMLELRPIVISDEMKALGGNMRLRALQHISKMKPAELDDLLATIPDYKKATDGERDAVLNHWRAWLKKPTAPVVYASTLTEQEQRRFIILDNVGFGDWDWDELANNWDGEELGDWGLPVWDANPKDFGANDGSSFDGKLPQELNGVDLMADDLPAINGDDHTLKQRIIITYTDEQKDFLAALLGLASINKVQYDVTEFQDHTADESGTHE